MAPVKTWDGARWMEENALLAGMVGSSHIGIDLMGGMLGAKTITVILCFFGLREAFLIGSTGRWCYL